MALYMRFALLTEILHFLQILACELFIAAVVVVYNFNIVTVVVDACYSYFISASICTLTNRKF